MTGSAARLTNTARCDHQTWNAALMIADASRGRSRSRRSMIRRVTRTGRRESRRAPARPPRRAARRPGPRSARPRCPRRTRVAPATQRGVADRTEQRAEHAAHDHRVREQPEEARPREEEPEQQREDQADEHALADPGERGAAGGQPATDPLDAAQPRADDRDVLDGEPAVREPVDGALGVAVGRVRRHRPEGARGGGGRAGPELMAGQLRRATALAGSRRGYRGAQAAQGKRWPAAAGPPSRPSKAITRNSCCCSSSRRARGGDLRARRRGRRPRRRRDLDGVRGTRPWCRRLPPPSMQGRPHDPGLLSPRNARAAPSPCRVGGRRLGAVAVPHGKRRGEEEAWPVALRDPLTKGSLEQRGTERHQDRHLKQLRELIERGLLDDVLVAVELDLGPSR